MNYFIPQRPCRRKKINKNQRCRIATSSESSCICGWAKASGWGRGPGSSGRGLRGDGEGLWVAGEVSNHCADSGPLCRFTSADLNRCVDSLRPTRTAASILFEVSRSCISRGPRTLGPYGRMARGQGPNGPGLDLLGFYAGLVDVKRLARKIVVPEGSLLIIEQVAILKVATANYLLSLYARSLLRARL